MQGICTDAAQYQTIAPVNSLSSAKTLFLMHFVCVAMMTQYPHQYKSNKIPQVSVSYLHLLLLLSDGTSCDTTLP